MAEAARRASRPLATLSEAGRNGILEAMAAALEAAAPTLLAANAEDLRLAHQLTGDARLPQATLDRLKLDALKLREMISQVRAVAALPDPLNRTLDALELDDECPPFLGASKMHLNALQNAKNAAHRTLHLQKISVPLGVLAVIFEARPDAVTQIASLALKSGNALILKPGKEVEHTAIALVEVLKTALGAHADALALTLGRESIAELLQMNDLVDMVIPRGSSALVRYVQQNTSIPVLGHAEGICHIYVDAKANQMMALDITLDAKTDYPAACNSVETVLIHREIAADFLPKLVSALQAQAVQIHADSSVVPGALPVTDWHIEYGCAEISIGVVDSLDAAIEHIHTHGSLHTETIVTEDVSAAERFLREVDAASVMHNASTRFADGFRYGFGAEVGVSTSKFHARGPVGLDGLTTYKYLVRGAGHTVKPYRTEGKAFTHRRKA
jgi:glutamate-5-semialdehyde dehydrogenase